MKVKYRDLGTACRELQTQVITKLKVVNLVCCIFYIKSHKNSMLFIYYPISVITRGKDKQILRKTSSEATVHELNRPGYNKCNNICNCNLFFTFRINESSNITSLN